MRCDHSVACHLPLEEMWNERAGKENGGFSRERHNIDVRAATIEVIVHATRPRQRNLE